MEGELGIGYLWDKLTFMNNIKGLEVIPMLLCFNPSSSPMK